jgi:hypothetical protein
MGQHFGLLNIYDPAQRTCISVSSELSTGFVLGLTRAASVTERLAYAPSGTVEICTPDGALHRAGGWRPTACPICPRCKGSLVEIAKIAPMRGPLICPAPYRSALHASPAMGPLEYYQKLLANGPARPYLHGGLVQASNFLLASPERNFQGKLSLF